MSKVTVAEKLSAIGNNMARVYDTGFEKGFDKGRDEGFEKGHNQGFEEGHDQGFEEGRAEGFEEGHDQGFEEGKQAERDAIYQDITITQDCTDALQCWKVLSASNNETDKLVLFVNKKWNALPDSTFANNTLLYMLWQADEFRINAENRANWIRWRDNAYATANTINRNYDCIMSAGDEFIKVVIL
jgi:hypothetical protein